jgi:MFS family permease
VFTGLGALTSRRFGENPRLMPILVVALALLTVFYQFGLSEITESLLSEGLAVRVIVSIALLAPLGFILGMFMPLGLSVISGLSSHGDEYVAWGWAVNGFFSVIGSVLTTILAMSFGFRLVQYLALGIYVLAALVFTRLRAIAKRTVDVTEEPPSEPLPEPAISTT